MTNFSARVNGLFLGTRPWSYGFHFTANTDVATAATTLHDATNVFWTTATSGYQHHSATDSAVVSVQAATHNATWRLTSKKVLALAITGDSGSNTLPWYVACTIKMFGAVDNGSDRGFIKLPAPVVADMDAQAFSATFTGHVSTRLEQFWTDMSALTGFTVVSFNRHVNKLGDPPFTNHTLTDSEVSNKPGTNRQRTRKVVPVYGADEPIP